jgi:hypothetical protein
MSANLYWQPVIIKKRYLSTMAPSSYIASLQKAFGQLPVQLGQSDIGILKGMAAVNNDFEELIKILHDFDSITIWAEY